MNPVKAHLRMGAKIMSESLELNKIYHGDCLAGLRSMPSDFIDLTVTSPPYDNLRHYNGNSTWDFEGISAELYRVTKPGGVVVWIVGDSTVNGSESCTSFKQALRFREVGFNLNDTMIWQKICQYQHPVRYIQAHEYMFIFSKGRPKNVNPLRDRKNSRAGQKINGTERQADGRLKKQAGAKVGRVIREYGARLNIWDILPNCNNKTNHPATFPVQLARDHIITWSALGDTVLDPFMGSGTTAIACIETGRNYIGFEIDEAYHAEAVARVGEFEQRSGGADG